MFLVARFTSFTVFLCLLLMGSAVHAQIETTTADGRRVVIIRQSRQPETVFDRLKMVGEGRRPLVGVGGRRRSQPLLNLRVLRSVVTPTRIPRARGGFGHWYATNHLLPWAAIAFVGITLITSGMSVSIKRDQ
ncbi:MAG: hypothetical protein KF812_00945 [Fimbriimonadaceae bacterium]|nr:hypothetical protein [Fimbriimonadaceae bacterium]